jgi:hypothetical protein
MGAALSRAVQSQTQQLAAMAGRLSAFKDQKQQDVRQLQSHVAAAEAGIHQLQALMVRQAEAAAEHGSRALQQAGGAVCEYAATAVAAAGELEAAMRAAVGALVTCLEEQAEQLRAFAAKQA